MTTRHQTAIKDCPKQSTENKTQKRPTPQLKQAQAASTFSHYRRATSTLKQPSTGNARCEARLQASGLLQRDWCSYPRRPQQSLFKSSRDAPCKQCSILSERHKATCRHEPHPTWTILHEPKGAHNKCKNKEHIGIRCVLPSSLTQTSPGKSFLVGLIWVHHITSRRTLYAPIQTQLLQGQPEKPLSNIACPPKPSHVLRPPSILSTASYQVLPSQIVFWLPSDVLEHA